MKIAVIGSRGLNLDNLGDYLPANVTEIISGGAKGIDQCAKAYALAHKIAYVEFLPQYDKYGKAAPLKRNDEIIKYADRVLAFWDGHSHGTGYVIEQCRRWKIPHTVHVIKDESGEKIICSELTNP